MKRVSIMVVVLILRLVDPKGERYSVNIPWKFKVGDTDNIFFGISTCHSSNSEVVLDLI